MFQEGHSQAAKEILERQVQAHPADLASCYALGVCLNAQGAWAAAEPHLRTVIVAEPEHHLAVYELGKSLQGQGRSVEAAGLYRQALLRENIPDAWRRLQELECPQAGSSVVPRPDTVPTNATTNLSASPEMLAALAHDRLIPSPSPFRTLASDLDDRDAPDLGQRVWTTRTQIRAQVPAAVFATLLCVIVPGFFRQELITVGLALYAVITWIAAFTTSWASRFDFYERRVDAAQGVFDRSKSVIWYATITQVSYVRGALDYLTHTASLEITYMVGSEPKVVKLPGLGSPREVNRLYEELQGPVVRERRAMKKILF